MLGAVQVRAKAHAFVGNFAEIGEAEDLIASGIGENRAAPGHERVQTAQLSNQLVTRTQIEVVGVRQNYACAQFFERFLRKIVVGRGRAKLKENGSLDALVGD